MQNAFTSCLLTGIFVELKLVFGGRCATFPMTIERNTKAKSAHDGFSQ